MTASRHTQTDIDDPPFRRVARTTTPLFFCLLTLLLSVTSCSDRVRKGEIEIVVDANAQVVDGISLAIPSGKQTDEHGNPLRYNQVNNLLLQTFFPGRYVQRITIVRYIGKQGNPRDPDELREALLELSRGEFEEPYGMIPWAERNYWMIEGRIEFAKGPSARVITDGAHTCLIDNYGRPWFFRVRDGYVLW